MISELFAAAGGGNVQVGEHPQWHILGMTINADTVISTAIAALIVMAFAFYLARKTTSKVPSRLQLIF
jgi:F-type H+-transporting ATPase subunit a